MSIETSGRKLSIPSSSFSDVPSQSLPTTNLNMSGDKELESLVDMFAAAGPSTTAPKKEVTYADFQKMLDETPLFMRDAPEDGSDNPVLEGLRSLIFEGEGDGELGGLHIDMQSLYSS
jgi:hypothetical protein